MPLDLKVRPIVDEQYIIPKTVDYIKRNAAAKKPFFVYVGYSEVHPPIIGNPNFANKSTQRSGLFERAVGQSHKPGQVQMGLGEAISSTRHSKEACGCLR
jgi:arylsulfatase